MLTLDRPKGEALKDKGQQAAFEFSGEWRDTVLAEFASWLAAQKAQGFTTITIESFRAQTKSHPHSANAWGALPRMAMTARLIEPAWAAPGVQARVKAAAPRTHAHEVKVWRVL